jgi:hypothetical protein
MKRILIAATLAAGLMSGVAFAQDDAADMNTGLSMLELAVGNQFTKLGIEGVDPMSLSLSQLAEIKNVVGNSERNSADMKQQVEQILSR